ncbi:unnamed protein product [Rotaria socialis]|uniref:Uncharacterized protein n=1 Tax=Rotaria socialis TaxID=392032 RepID=A0A821I2W1_9BILA|nr:unnamed protein product [Rotaria socialis]
MIILNFLYYYYFSLITYRQGTDERAKRALDKLQSTFRCCGSDGRLSYQNNVPLSCNMYSIGCLTRTMFFLESWMDVLAYILLFFSLIKLFIVLFFFSLLCLYQRNGRNRLKNNRNLINGSSAWRHSLSVDSSSGDNLSKAVLMPTTIINNDEHGNVEKRSVIQNEYDTAAAAAAAATSSSSSNQRTQNTSMILPPSSAAYNNALAIAYEPYASRKLSSISERTEKSETDESEPDNTRLKNLNSQRKAIITSVYPKQYLPLLSKQLPIVKSRRKHVREDDNDSGVERSSSEKSFDDQQKSHVNNSTIANPTANSKQTNNKSSNLLGFSNVFITSSSQKETKDDHVPSTDIIMPRPILKKSSPHSSPDRIIIDFRDQKNLSSTYTNTSPLLYKIPKPIPRSTLKQSKQDESLV